MLNVDCRCFFEEGGGSKKLSDLLLDKAGISHRAVFQQTANLLALIW